MSDNPWDFLPAEWPEIENEQEYLALTMMQDLRTVALHGPCRCGGRAIADDIHLASCPHIRYSKVPLMLVRR